MGTTDHLRQMLKRWNAREGEGCNRLPGVFHSLTAGKVLGTWALLCGQSGTRFSLASIELMEGEVIMSGFPERAGAPSVRQRAHGHTTMSRYGNENNQDGRYEAPDAAEV